jgi:YfiH family protein
MTNAQPNEGFVWTQAPWGAVLQSEALGGVAAHFFTARDLGLHGSAGTIERGYDAIAAAIGVTRDNLAQARQVHGANVHEVWSRSRETPTPDADILISRDPSAAVAVRVADCVPLLMADPRSGAVAAAHAGWRGMAAGVPRLTVMELVSTFGASRSELLAAVGPSIGPCCYEVGDELPGVFRAAAHTAAELARWFTRRPNGRWRLDLWEASRDQLARAGVKPSHVYVSGLCTSCHRDAFYSYRADGPGTGRMLGVIRPPHQRRRPSPDWPAGPRER